MRLFECESRDSLRAAGIPAAEGIVAKNVSVPASVDRGVFLVAAEAQGLTCERMKAGAIAIEDTREQAKTEVARLLGMDVRGRVYRQALIESRAGVAVEYHLGIAHDDDGKNPAAVFSSRGGIHLAASVLGAA